MHFHRDLRIKRIITTAIFRRNHALFWNSFNKEHYSTISYQPQHLHYHYINGKSLNQIDIGLTNHDGKLYKWNEIGRFHLILVFEIELNDEISKEFIKLYNQEGYEKAHTADKLILRKR